MRKISVIDAAWRITNIFIVLPDDVSMSSGA